MAFHTANELFDKVFNRNITADESSEFKRKLSDYLLQMNSAEAKQMGIWIKNGGKLTSFRCREDLVYPIADELSERHIPYALIVRTDGQLGFLTRRDDNESVGEAKKVVLERMGHNCTIVSTEEMKEQLSKLSKEERAMITLNGLSEEFVELLREIYTEKYKDCTIAIDKRLDGTYSVGLPGEANVVRNRKESQTDLCHTYLSIVLKEAGPYGAMVMARAALRNQFNEAMARGFISEERNLQKTPLWIVGRGTQYVKVMGRSFEYGRAVKDGKGGVDLKKELQAVVAQPNYQELLFSKCQRIPDKMMTYSYDEVIEHYKTELNSDAYDSLDSSESAEERNYIRREQKFINKIDSLVYTKIQGDTTMLMRGRYDEKIIVYMRTAKELLSALVSGTIPTGFEAGDIDELYQVIEETGIDIDEYTNALTRLGDVEPVLIKTAIERIADVDQMIEHSKEVAKVKTIEREIEREQKALEFKALAKSLRAPKSSKEEADIEL